MNNSYFAYNPGNFPEDTFRISPSQLSKFLDTTTQWYRENLLEETGFEGSTASELGNVIHAAMHMYFDTRSVDKQALINYINSISNPDVDKTLILAQYKPMIDSLINNFLSKNIGTHAEEFVSYEILPGVVAAGSIDMYDEHKATIYDYKTMGSLDIARVPTAFPRAYWFQQLAYAWILIQNGRPVEYLKLVYQTRENVNRISEKTGKPMKDYPAETHILTHKITTEDLTIIENTLKLVAHSVKTWKEFPELRFMLAQDFRLYTPPKPKLFKDN